jgi:hypothetical protein
LIPVLRYVFVVRPLGHPMPPAIAKRRIVRNFPVLVLEAKIGVYGEYEGIDPSATGKRKYRKTLAVPKVELTFAPALLIPSQQEGSYPDAGRPHTR